MPLGFPRRLRSRHFALRGRAPAVGVGRAPPPPSPALTPAAPRIARSCRGGEFRLRRSPSIACHLPRDECSTRKPSPQRRWHLPHGDRADSDGLCQGQEPARPAGGRPGRKVRRRRSAGRGGKRGRQAPRRMWTSRCVRTSQQSREFRDFRVFRGYASGSTLSDPLRTWPSALPLSASPPRQPPGR